MTFFSRPILENLQFKQFNNNVLTLSGQTQIATTSGLTLATGNTGVGGVIITASGASSATNNYVLTYDDNDQIIKLKETSASGGTLYTGRNPTTCTVGGLTANTNIFNSNIDYILECVLAPVINPTLIEPTISSFTISNNSTLLEVGSSLSISGLVRADLGAIDSNFSGVTDTRSSGVSGYSFGYFGLPPNFISSAGLFKTYSGSGIINVDENLPIIASIHFCDGVQPYNSTGGTYCTPYSASIVTENKSIFGIYPWYWGTESSGFVGAGENRPSGACIKDNIYNGSSSSYGSTVCKVVDLGESTLDIPFNSNHDKYIWFALPDTVTPKTNWESLSNNGVIGDLVNVGGNLFPEPEEITNVSTPIWSGQTYNVYISNYQSSVSSIMKVN